MPKLNTQEIISSLVYPTVCNQSRLGCNNYLHCYLVLVDNPALALLSVISINLPKFTSSNNSFMLAHLEDIVYPLYLAQLYFLEIFQY